MLDGRFKQAINDVFPEKHNALACTFRHKLVAVREASVMLLPTKQGFGKIPLGYPFLFTRVNITAVDTLWIFLKVLT